MQAVLQWKQNCCEHAAIVCCLREIIADLAVRCAPAVHCGMCFDWQSHGVSFVDVIVKLLPKGGASCDVCQPKHIGNCQQKHIVVLHWPDWRRSSHYCAAVPGEVVGGRLGHAGLLLPPKAKYNKHSGSLSSFLACNSKTE